MPQFSLGMLSSNQQRLDASMTQALAVKCSYYTLEDHNGTLPYPITFSTEQTAQLERPEHRTLWFSGVYSMVVGSASAQISEALLKMLSGTCLDQDLLFTVVEDFWCRPIEKVYFIHPSASTCMRF